MTSLSINNSHILIMQNPKWTVATVNYNSYDFVQYQLKFFHEFNKDFEFFVHDNQSETETEESKKIKADYPDVNYIHAIRFGKGWGAHGIALNNCMKRSKGKYFLAIDPDFFWMKKEILPFLESYLDSGYHAVGTEYFGHPFPAIWGIACITNEIKDLNLMAKSSFCEKCKEWVYDRDYDTGWQLKIRLGNKPFHAFRQVANQVPDFGTYVNKNSQTYVFDEKVIAHHLKSACFKSQNHKETNEKYINWIWNNIW